MAPHASTSRARRSPSASSDEGGGRPAQARKRGQAADSESEEDVHAAELAALELKDPLKTCRHLFLQALIARKSLPLDKAQALYKECVRLCKVEDPPALETFVAQMEPGLSLCGLDIKTTRDQESGAGLYILVNTIQDEPAKVATEYKAEEIAFFKAVLEKIMLAPRLSYSITQTDAVRCAKAPITRSAAIQLVKSLLAKGWLSLHSSGRLILSPRSLVELAPYLRETFADDDEDDDETDPRHRVVVDCNDCLAIVTSGYACPNAACGVRLHTFCAPRRLGANGQCPDHFANPDNPCKHERASRTWPRDPTSRKFYGVPIGIAALEGEGEGGADESVRATSEAGGTSPPPAAATRKGKGKKKAPAEKGKGKKRGRAAAASEEEEDEEEEQEDELDDDSDDAASRDQSSASPVVKRTSLRASKQKRKIAPPDSDEDEED
ncbi:hypothetical protein JCM3770_001077 [Rhodotorula araucariae]